MIHKKEKQQPYIRKVVSCYSEYMEFEGKHRATIYHTFHLRITDMACKAADTINL